MRAEALSRSTELIEAEVKCSQYKYVMPDPLGLGQEKVDWYMEEGPLHYTELKGVLEFGSPFAEQHPVLERYADRVLNYNLWEEP